MAITQTLSNAISGLSAAKRGAEIASNNIANALTEGYGAREITLGARDIGGYGGGVIVTGMLRNVNPAVLAERRLTDAEMGQAQSRDSTLKELESIFGKVGDGSSLSARVTRVEKALLTAATDPSSDGRLEGAAREVDSLAGHIRGLATRLSTMRESAETKITEQVDMLNAGLQKVDELNDNIVRYGQMGQPTAGLIDQRQQVIDSLSDLVPLRQLSRNGGRVALITTSGETLLDARPRKVGFQPVGRISQQMTRQNGALMGLTLDGHEVAGNGPAGHLSGGAIGAAFEARDVTVPDAHRKLDAFAANLQSRLSDSTVDSTIAPSGPGLLVSSPLPPATGTVGVAQSLKLNPDLSPDGGTPALLRDGMGSAGTGPTGNATLLRGWASALTRSEPMTPGGTPRSAAAHASQFSAETGLARVRGERELSFAVAKRESLLQRERAEGVDTDKEMQDLMRLEQAYAANAKVIQTVDRLMRKLLEM